MKNTYLFLLVSFFTIQLFAQKAPIKFGKIDIEDLKMEYYELDSSASAVVLCDYGRGYFIYNSIKGFQYKLEVIKRIKILKKEGVEQANFEIPLYERENSEEKTGLIKGYTYNLVGGKVTKSKLKKSDVYTEQTSENWRKVKFTLPNVNVGSVVEVQYNIVSDFWFNLDDWYFQDDIPVKWSEFRITIPEYFNYKTLTRGYEPLYITESSTKNEKFTYQYEGNRPNKYGQGQTTGGTETFNSLSTYYRFASKDMKAFGNEPYLTTAENYITKVEFELATVQFPGKTLENYTTNWEAINKKLLDDTDFGWRLKRSKSLQNIVDALITNINDDYQKAEKIHNCIKQNVKWNNSYSIYAYKPLKEVLSDGSGNVAEINMLLILMLNKANLKADPVLLSTRSHGIIYPGRPMISAFNYLIAKVEINGKDYLIDATEKNCPINILPRRCLNGKARVISETNPAWIDLSTEAKFKSTTILDIDITEDQIKGKKQNIHYNYAALDLRNKIDGFKNQEEYIEDIKKKNTGLNIKEYSFENIDSIYLPVKEEYTFELNDRIIDAGNLKYFNPIFFERTVENPFKIEDRKYPVDYAYKIEETYILNFTIPEGYTIEELPETKKIALLNNAGSYIYNIMQLGNKIQITSKFNINKSLFVSDEYKAIKEFYNQIVAKQNEQIILKKL